MLAKILAR